METVVSGIRPTGMVHLGNYFGAIKNFVLMQQDSRYQSYFFIADYHSLTTHTEAKELQQNVKAALAIYLGCGLDPEKSTIYIQSHLPQIPELYLLFNMLAYKGELEKVPTFKEKVRAQEQTGKSINAGLLTYPVLMAVDIIIHRAHKVPVGKDQEPHLEMARNFVNRFNYLFANGEAYFPEPFAFNYGAELVKVPSLDGTGKMSKSAENPLSAIYLLDEDEVIRKKIMKAVSDSGPTEPNQQKPEVIENLFDLLRLASAPDTVNYFEEQYNNCNIRYGDLKKQLAQDMITLVKPIRERINEIKHNEAFIKKTAEYGAEKARQSAAETLKGAKELVGLQYF
ncbi:tryptophan--tRNA ligase [Sphingobacteriales bacterium UPWRP_1]|nr:tryptophan--tRNA ligase [Sphingobacteriales bacterium TSM_CSS]PSJ77671.1 tryptophan--tRNA ligase [Sphingobacteriales bacterium UPWRP_1]